ncbi:MAG: hypothetical protein KF751_09635 [Nitrospira sp.]|nr:hypothetical protein [Nitrospira sp.]MBX3349480.1 hypothetical protein [Nitrospira sp.]
MTRWKDQVTHSAQTPLKVMNGEQVRQPVHEKWISLSARMRGIDCMLADIEAQIRRLRREKTYLGLVREWVIDKF